MKPTEQRAMARAQKVAALADAATQPADVPQHTAGRPLNLAGRVACPVCQGKVKTTPRAFVWRCQRCGRDWLAERADANPRVVALTRFLPK